MKKYKKRLESHAKKNGFTLIEVLVVIGIIAVLAAVVLVAVNPARQFKIARDSQRTANVTAILNAVGQDLSEHSGVFKCSGSTLAIPISPAVMKSSSGFNIAPCLVPNYISSLPYDPSATGAHYTSNSDYDAEYTIYQDSDGRVTVTASGELSGSPISVTR